MAIFEWLQKWLEPSTIATATASVAAIWHTYETQILRRATVQQAKDTALLTLFPIVEKHHSPEIAALRRFAITELPIFVKKREITEKCSLMSIKLQQIKHPML